MAHRFLFLFAFSAGVLASVSSCSSETTRPVAASSGGPQGGIGGGGTTTDGGASDADADAGACTDLANTGPLVDQIGVQQDLPTGQGGMIQDGTYDLREARIYVGSNPPPSGTSFQGSLRVTGTTIDIVSAITPVQGNVAKISQRGTGSVMGVNLTYAIACPSAQQKVFSYTAAGPTLTLNDLLTKESFVYSKK